MSVNLDEIIKEIEQSADKKGAMQHIMTEQLDKIKTLETTQCGPACQERQRQLDQAMHRLEEAENKEPPKAEHHLIKPFDKSCPGCNEKNKYPIEPEDINTELFCSECDTPVLAAWTNCPKCGEVL